MPGVSMPGISVSFCLPLLDNVAKICHTLRERPLDLSRIVMEFSCSIVLYYTCYLQDCGLTALTQERNSQW